VTLSEPTQELAERLKREVGHEERLVGMKMSVMGGSNPTPLYTFASAAGFLRIGSYEDAMRPNNQETIGYIDLGAVEQWVRGVFGDDELADAIKAEIDTGDPFGIAAPRVRELMQVRALQLVPAEDTGVDDAVPAAAQ